MIDEAKLNRDITRQAQAEALMRSELLTEAFATLEQQYLDALLMTRPMETEVREKLYLAVNVNRKVKDHLQTVIDRGKVSRRELNQLTGKLGRPRLVV